LHGCIVSVRFFRIEHIAAQHLSDRCEQRCGIADLAGQDRAIQLDTFACEDLRLTIQRCMVRELRRNHMRQ